MAHQVKHLPVMQETQETRVQSLGREDPLEKYITTHFSILAPKIPWTVHGQQSMQSQRVRHNLVTEQQDSFQGK